MIGRCLLEVGNFDEAARELDTAIKNTHGDPSATVDLRFQLGLALEAGGKMARALEAVRDRLLHRAQLPGRRVQDTRHSQDDGEDVMSRPPAAPGGRRIDLHTHTHFSDGSLSPPALAVARGRPAARGDLDHRPRFGRGADARARGRGHHARAGPRDRAVLLARRDGAAHPRLLPRSRTTSRCASVW